MLDGEDEFVFSGIVLSYISFTMTGLYMPHSRCLARKGEVFGDGSGGRELVLCFEIGNHEVQDFSLSLRQMRTLPH